MVALQCAQPLVYWLRRQLILVQELAADESAAIAVGGHSEYLRALSRFAPYGRMLGPSMDRWPCSCPVLLPGSF